MMREAELRQIIDGESDLRTRLDALNRNETILGPADAQQQFNALQEQYATIQHAKRELAAIQRQQRDNEPLQAFGPNTFYER
jgi:hypothetical protein